MHLKHLEKRQIWHRVYSLICHKLSKEKSTVATKLYNKVTSIYIIAIKQALNTDQATI